MTIVTFADFARHKGVSREAVSKAIRTGRLFASLVEENGQKTKLNLDLANREWVENTDTKRKKFEDIDQDQENVPALRQKMPPLNQSRLVLETYKARLAKLEYEEKVGKLIDADQVRESAFKLARQTRDGVLNIADRVAADLAAETDAFKVHARLTKEIREALRALALVADESDLPESVQ